MRKRNGGIRRLGWVTLAVCVIVAVLAAGAYEWTNSGRIYPGVQVDGVPLGSKTPAEARKVVKNRVAGRIDRIKLTSGSRTINRPARELGVGINVKRTAGRAYSVGRKGSVLKQLTDRVRATFGTVEVRPVVKYRPRLARQELQSVASHLDLRPRNASVSISGSRVRAVPSREGYKIDISTTARNIRQALRRMDDTARLAGKTIEPRVGTESARKAAERARTAMSGPLTLRSGGKRWTIAPEQVGQILSVSRHGSRLHVSIDEAALRNTARPMYSSLDESPRNASFKVSGDSVSVVPGHEGRKVEDTKLLKEIENKIFDGDHSVHVPVKTVEPSLTTARAKRLKPTKLIGSYKTDYTWDEESGQMANYRISSKAINNTILAPGQIFSFNKIAAPLHYKPSKVIINGKVETADGGGLCQISSTLYMAANLAGLKPLERHPHYAILPYIRPGFDATVWFGSLDMKFKNTSPGYVLIKEWVGNDGYVHAQIWGRPTGKHVSMTSRKVSSTPEESKWITYKKVTRNGQVISDKVLHEDTYKPLKASSG
jgi:vancomycin resistance protein YoaR